MSGSLETGYHCVPQGVTAHMVNCSLGRLLSSDPWLGRNKFGSASSALLWQNTPFTLKQPLYSRQKNPQYGCNRRHKKHYINLCLSIDFIQTSLHFVDVDIMNFSLLRALGCDGLFIRNEFMIIFILPFRSRTRAMYFSAFG